MIKSDTNCPFQGGDSVGVGLSFVLLPLCVGFCFSSLFCDVDYKNLSFVITRDHRLASLGKPRDAKRRSPGQIFLSYPHANNGFFFLLTTVFFN